MAPDRGDTTPLPPRSLSADESDDLNSSSPPDLLAARASEPQNFTLRGILVGLVIGIIICFSNTYFGLQTGWVSGMAMPSALLGFAYFKLVTRLLSFPFSPVENVLVQSVAGAVGTMPLGCGLVAVIPAMEYLLNPEEGGPLRLSLSKLIVWAVGICFFGVTFAVPLRRQVIIRERLKFPSGTATALMIGVLHGEKDEGKVIIQDTSMTDSNEEEEEDARDNVADSSGEYQYGEMSRILSGQAANDMSDWKAEIRHLLIAFTFSSFYTLISYFVPQIRNIPLFGSSLATNWLWTLNPSPAYIGQGIIMGPSTTLHMFLGAIVGWGILSPLAKYNGWAPGPVSNWTDGSKGWIVWVSLAIMLADSLVSLGWLILRPLIKYGPSYYTTLRAAVREHGWYSMLTIWNLHSRKRYYVLDSQDSALDSPTPWKLQSDNDSLPGEADAPPEHLISTRTTTITFLISILICIAAVQYSFNNLLSIPLTLLALACALILSIMGVRALGETDLNPVSGISKLTQLVFALVVPASASKHAVPINLLAGAISESGALQAGDLMQDLKAGHLLGAAPAAQFWGQMIGSAVGAVVAAAVYRLYSQVYEIPGSLFQVPTGYVWVFTARLVTGKGLPVMVGEWAAGFGAVFALTTGLRVWGNTSGRRWISTWVPGGIAVAVGMYNTPSFTLARTIGGLISIYWQSWLKRQETPIIVLASGLILGEGLFSIVNLVLASLDVPHL